MMLPRYPLLTNLPMPSVTLTRAPSYSAQSPNKAGLTTVSETGELQTTNPRSYYDISYLLNASLWDRFYFSTIDNSQDGPINPNQTILSEAAISNDPAEVAANLVYQGMFNVNSTSVSAWKAFLGASRDYLNTANASASNLNSFPRSLQQLPVAIDTPTGSDNDSYAGSRLLSDAEIDSLAQAMVRQVRLRGPFVSFSHFVNRSLANATAEREISRQRPSPASSRR